MTEEGSILSNGRIARPPVLDYKLRDVLELRYRTTDRPFPRGELCVKTASATPGYWNQPELTAGLFDANGYLRTGDVMEERSRDELVYIERANEE